MWVLSEQSNLFLNRGRSVWVCATLNGSTTRRLSEIWKSIQIIPYIPAKTNIYLPYQGTTELRLKLVSVILHCLQILYV